MSLEEGEFRKGIFVPSRTNNLVNEDFNSACAKDFNSFCVQCGKGFYFETYGDSISSEVDDILCANDFLFASRILEEHEVLLDSEEESDFHDKCNQLRVLCANVDILTNKMDELTVRVLSEKPDIICLQEILPKNPTEEIVPEVEFKIDGYEMHTPSMMRRGVATLVRNGIQSVQVEPNEEFEESVWCIIMGQRSEKTLIGNIYRSPSSDCENSKKMCAAISEMCRKGYEQIIVCGDFNLKEINWEC